MTLTNKKIAVTGGCGFIGSHIVQRLAGDGNDVVVIDNLDGGNTGNIAGLEGAITFHNVSVIDDLTPYLDGVDIIFHLAANVSVIKSIEDPVYNNKINIDGTLNVLENARKLEVKKVVYSSSCAVYGDAGAEPVPETAKLEPISPYGRSKMIAEQHCMKYANKYGLDTVSLRYFNVYGPRQAADSPYSGVIALFIKKALASEMITIYGDGEQSRDFIEVSDVVNANLAAAGTATSGEAFNIGTGRPTTVNELADTIGDITGKLKRHYAPARKGEIRHSRAEISKAGEILVFKPEKTLEQGLKDLIGELKN